MSKTSVEEFYPNGDAYVGETINGVKWGQGRYTFANGSQYEGAWEDGRMNGWGTFREASTGDNFEGEWENGMRRHGLYFYHCGNIYQGEFKNNAKNGRGIVWENRVMYEVLYNEDRLVDKVEFNTRATSLRAPVFSTSPSRRATQTVKHADPRPNLSSSIQEEPLAWARDLGAEDLQELHSSLQRDRSRTSSATRGPETPNRREGRREERAQTVKAVTARLYPYSQKKPEVRKKTMSSRPSAPARGYDCWPESVLKERFRFY